MPKDKVFIKFVRSRPNVAGWCLWETTTAYKEGYKPFVIYAATPGAAFKQYTQFIKAIEVLNDASQGYYNVN